LIARHTVAPKNRARGVLGKDTNVTSSRVRTDVHAAAEPRGDDSNAVFARRTAGGKYRRQESVLLCETQFRDFFDRSWAPTDTRLANLVAISFFARADQNAGTFPGTRSSTGEPGELRFHHFKVPIKVIFGDLASRGWSKQPMRP